MMRVIWGALIMGQVMFMVVEGIILSQRVQGNVPAKPPDVWMLFYVNVGMLLTVVPVMYLVRGAMFRRKRNAEGILPAATYATGNIIFWAGCEGVSFFGSVVAMIWRSFGDDLCGGGGDCDSGGDDAAVVRD